MLHLMRAVDRALGYAFVSASQSDPDQALNVPKTQMPNSAALFSSALGSIPTSTSVQDVQERWVDHREGYDAWEKAQWRREGEIARAAETEAKEKSNVIK